MHDALPMRVLQRTAQLRDPRGRFRHRHRDLTGQPLGEASAVEELQDEVGRLLSPDVVDAADMRMLQARDGPGFAEEPPAAFGILQSARNDLDGHHALEAGVQGAVHLAHAAAAEEGFDDVRPEPGPGRKMLVHGLILSMHGRPNRTSPWSVHTEARRSTEARRRAPDGLGS